MAKINYNPIDSHLLSPTQETVLGTISVDPPFSKEEVQFLDAFLKTHHYAELNSFDLGLYKTDNPSYTKCQLANDSSFLEKFKQGVDALTNKKTQEFVPSLTCPLVIIQNTKTHEFDSISINNKHELRTHSAEWLVFMIEHFFKKDAFAKIINPNHFNFLHHHILNGQIWQKAGKTWNAQQIVAINNEIFLSYASIPINQKETNSPENKILRINLINHRSVLKEHGMVALGNNFYQKQYHDMSIKCIADYNKTTKLKKIELKESERLNKILLNSTLNNNLKINEKSEKKTKL